MRRKEIINRLSKEADATKQDSGIFLDALLRVIKNALKDGETVQLFGFGDFEARERKECFAKDPITKEGHAIPSHNVCKFTASRSLNRFLNEEKGE